VGVLFKLRGHFLYFLLARMAKLTQTLSGHIVQPSKLAEKGYPGPMENHGSQQLADMALSNSDFVSGHNTETLFLETLSLLI
jgi:hypothetical protein